MRKKSKLLSGVLMFAMVMTVFPGIPANRVYAEEQTTEVATETDAVIDMASEDITYAGTGYDSLVVDAGETLALNATNFPDANFRAYLCEEFDADGNGYINPSMVTEIYCSYKQIASLKGIEYFLNLRVLDCEGNNLTQLDVSKNTNLEYLECWKNNLIQLDVSKNTNLGHLGCGGNNLTKIDMSKNVNLQVAGWNSPENDSFAMVIDGKRYISCFDVNGDPVINQFKCDGTYTYYFQADGTAMMDRLTYHPDGVHVIYFDEYGHEVFSDFSHVQKSIAGDAVDDYCFYDVNGYMYTDVLTYDKAGKSILYANPYGVLEHTSWFQFSDGGYGYANATLMTDQYTYDWNGNLVYMEGGGHIRGTGDGRNLWSH